MPGYAPIHPLVGVQPFNEMLTPDTVQRNQLGLVCDAVDPYFGWGRFVYLKTAGAHAVGRLVTITSEAFTVLDLPNTANLGYPFFVARAKFSATDQFGWFQFEGVCPVQTAASVAAGVAVGIGAAGQAGTNSAGKQLLGVKVLRASTFTLTKVGSTFNGSTIIKVSNLDGLFIDLPVSGTGVPASSEIVTMDPSGTQFTIDNAATATGSVTITFTYTGFLLVHLNSPHGQGAIT